LHEIGAADEHRRVAAVLEPEDARVLEEAPDDGTNGDAIADARDPRPQAADAADDEIDTYARLRRAVESLDDFVVRQAVQLGDDPRGAPFTGVLHLAIDHRQYPPPQADRRHDQCVVVGLARVARQVIEDVRDVLDDGGPGGHEPEVRV